MSHEGIRFVSKEEQARHDVAERPLSRIAVTPDKVRVKITEGTGLEIDWQDGHKSTWNFAWLRDACPCATCIDERKAQGRKAGQPKPKPTALLPMYYRASQARQARTEWAATLSSSTGPMVTPGGIYLGTTCAATRQCAECKFEATESTGHAQLIASLRYPQSQILQEVISYCEYGSFAPFLEF